MVAATFCLQSPSTENTTRSDQNMKFLGFLLPLHSYQGIVLETLKGGTYIFILNQEYRQITPMKGATF